jgi:GNAT superfamily N-acetyltransferase
MTISAILVREKLGVRSLIFKKTVLALNLLLGICLMHLPHLGFASADCVSAFQGGEVRFIRQFVGDGINQSAVRFDSIGRKLGEVEYEITDSGSIYIERAFVEKGSRGKGVYRQLVEEIIKRHPHVDAIEGDLGADNFAIYKKRRLDLGESAEEAIRHIPAYKIRVSLGFSKVDWVSSREYGEFFHLRMTRP